MNIDFTNIHTPCYICNEVVLDRNLQTLASVQERTGCRILLALKGFAMFSVFPQIRHYLSGVAANSLDEARLGFETFGKEVHASATAYQDFEFEDMLFYCSHITFNSFTQWNRFKGRILGREKKVSCGIHINPEHSETAVAMYDPCTPHSRLGVTRDRFEPDNLEGIAGLYFHTLYGNQADALERTLKVVEDKFGAFIKQMKWINFGGGHHITRPDYDVDRLCDLINDFKSRYSVQVYLEPGEAAVLDAGLIASSVLDIVHNQMDIAILDTSAVAHMPDVLKRPYRPDIWGAGQPGEFPYTCRMAGPTSLPGDIMGDYSFQEPLEVGAKVIFLNMAYYTMVKSNTFNGARLPSVGVADATGKLTVVRKFHYEDYRNRLS